jgi:hypothetical protein
MNNLKRSKTPSARRVRLVLLGLLSLGSVLLVTAGTVGETAMPPPVDNLEEMLSRVDDATFGIARQLAASAVSADWEPKTAEPPAAGPDAAVVPVVEPELLAAETIDSIRERVGKLRLDGIAWNEHTPVVFVSGKTLVLDADIEGLRVAHIGPESVVFEDERGHRQDLRLPDYSHLLQAKKD